MWPRLIQGWAGSSSSPQLENYHIIIRMPDLFCLTQPPQSEEKKRNRDRQIKTLRFSKKNFLTPPLITCFMSNYLDINY